MSLLPVEPMFRRMREEIIVVAGVVGCWKKSGAESDIVIQMSHFLSNRFFLQDDLLSHLRPRFTSRKLRVLRDRCFSTISTNAKRCVPSYHCCTYILT